MTDASPGPGWWQASDGEWYPPQPPAHEPIDWDKVAAERAARRKSAESARRRKIAGAALAAIATVALLAAVARNVADGSRNETAGNSPSTTTTTTATTSTTTTTAVTTPLPEGSVSVFSLQPGMCVRDADLLSGPVLSVLEVPCDQSHTHEVYHKVTYTPPDSAYDATRISEFATEQCSQSFATYVGIPFDRSKYYFLHFAPTEESWTQKGDREVVCLLFLQGSELVGSAQGTAQ